MNLWIVSGSDSVAFSFSWQTFGGLLVIPNCTKNIAVYICNQ